MLGSDLKGFKMCVGTSVCVCVEHMPWCACGGQKTISWGYFSSSILPWLLGLKPRSVGLRGKDFDLYHLHGSGLFL